MTNFLLWQSFLMLSPEACQHVFSVPRKGYQLLVTPCSTCTCCLSAAAIAVRNHHGSPESCTTECLHGKRRRGVKGDQLSTTARVGSEHLWSSVSQSVSIGSMEKACPRLGGCAAVLRESWCSHSMLPSHFPRL